MLSNKDINFDDEKQILTINGEEHAVGDPAIPGEIDALDERVTALEVVPGQIESLDERVTALENAGGGAGWQLLTVLDAPENSYAYANGLKFNDVNLFDENSEANEIIIFLTCTNAGRYFAPPIIIPIKSQQTTPVPQYRSVDAWESTKTGFMACRDSSYTDRLTLYSYNNGSNVKYNIYVR